MLSQMLLGARPAQGIVTRGLVLHVDFGDAACYPGSGTAWNDLSGNGNHGTLINGPTFSAANGGQIVFDGVNDFASVAGSATLTSATFAAWVRRTGSVGWAGILFNRASSIFGLNLRGDGIELGYTWNNAQGTYQWASGLTVPLNTWAMVAVTISPTSAAIYVNTARASQSFTHVPQSRTALEIARDSFSFRAFPGAIAIARMHNVELSEDEMNQNFTADKARFGL